MAIGMVTNLNQDPLFNCDASCKIETLTQVLFKNINVSNVYRILIIGAAKTF